MNQHFTGLQILRFAAAMLVVVMHITQAISIHITGQGADHYWGPGTAGVDIFFVISGFVMTITTRAPPDGAAARRQAGWVFFKRRLLRIVPLYWFYTLLKVALLLAVPALAVKSTIEPGHLAASLLFIPVTSPWGLVQPVLPVGWTLNFEMLFYAVFAIGIVLGAPRIRFCLLVFASLFLAGQYLPAFVPLAFFADSIIFEFILGVAIAHSMMRWRAGPPWLGAVLVLAGVAFTFGIAWDYSAARLVPWGVGAAVIVLGTVWLEPLIRKAPLASPLSFLGDASYSIYLSHTFVVPASVLLFLRLGLTDPIAILLLASALVMLAGSLSYIWLEKPMTSFFKRLFFRTAPLRYGNATPTASE